MSLNIINNSFNKCIDDLPVGETFTVENEECSIFNGYFMKIENRNSDMNAVNLTNAKLYNIRNDKLLQVIKIDLIV